MNKRIIFITPVIAVILSLILFFIALKRDWFGQSGIIGLNYCEHSRDALIKQPANTFSNIGFIIVGLVIGWQLMKRKYSDNKNRMSTSDFYATFFSTLCILMGPASMAMHASTSIIGGYFDVLSMYLLAGFMVAYAFVRFYNLKSINFFYTFSFVLLICNLVFFHRETIFGWIDRNTIFGVFIVLAALFVRYVLYLIRLRIVMNFSGMCSIPSCAICLLLEFYFKFSHFLVFPMVNICLSYAFSNYTTL